MNVYQYLNDQLSFPDGQKYITTTNKSFSLSIRSFRLATRLFRLCTRVHDRLDWVQGYTIALQNRFLCMYDQSRGIFVI